MAQPHVYSVLNLLLKKPHALVGIEANIQKQSTTEYNQKNKTHSPVLKIPEVQFNDLMPRCKHLKAKPTPKMHFAYISREKQRKEVKNKERKLKVASP